MSFGRNTHDAAVSRRYPIPSERRNTNAGKSKTVINASAGRTKRFNDTLNLNTEQDGNSDRYLITYADLITLLLGLFIILYVSSNIDMNKYQKMVSSLSTTLGGNSNIKFNSTVTGMKTIPDLSTKMQELILTSDLKDFIRVEENDRGVTIHILDDILFGSGDAMIKKSSTKILSGISTILKSIPNDIRIEGHTDNIPINNSAYQSNWHLSVARALNTAYYLINQENLPADRVSIVGYAEYRPVAENNTIMGRKLNRRVDIVIIKK